MEEEILTDAPIAPTEASADAVVVTTCSEEELTEVNENGKRPLDQMVETTGIAPPENGDMPQTNGHMINDTPLQSSPIRPRLNINKQAKDDARSMTHSNEQRWRPHVMAEDYVNFVGDMMYPKRNFGPYGYDMSQGRVPLEKIPTLGYLISPLRRPSVIEKWSPYDISIFESALTQFGKDFWQIAKLLKYKNTKDVIEFYYAWKKTDHYKQWKKGYTVDERDINLPPETKKE